MAQYNFKPGYSVYSGNSDSLLQFIVWFISTVTNIILIKYQQLYCIKKGWHKIILSINNDIYIESMYF